nr:toll/interleukin-1 receptor domain-containing protein [Hymenobacter lucidus]
MAQCTAPSRGHRTASGAAECPACGGRSRYSSYSRPSYPSYPSSYPSSGSSSRSGSGSTRTVRPRWSRGGSGSGGSSVILYTPAEVTTLTPIRENVEKQSTTTVPDRRDYFLCHAWDDRRDAAKDLHDQLVSCGASVWFSEKDVHLGSTLLREIDKGLAMSKVGIVLVTPALLTRLKREGIADKELSALLALDRLIPIVHNTTYEDLRDVSPLLGSRSGLNTKEETMAEVAAKLAELVAI